ncbi:MAG: hypothetical protein ABR978_06085 [Dehalococcoidia bacterium]
MAAAAASSLLPVAVLSRFMAPFYLGKLRLAIVEMDSHTLDTKLALD